MQEAIAVPWGESSRPEQKEDNERGRWLEGKRGFKDIQGPGSQGLKKMEVFWGKKQQSQEVWMQGQQNVAFILRCVEFEATEEHLEGDVIR